MPYYFPVEITVINSGGDTDPTPDPDPIDNDGDLIMAVFKQADNPTGMVAWDTWQRLDANGRVLGLYQFNADLNHWQAVFSHPIHFHRKEYDMPIPVFSSLSWLANVSYPPKTLIGVDTPKIMLKGKVVIGLEGDYEDGNDCFLCIMSSRLNTSQGYTVSTLTMEHQIALPLVNLPELMEVSVDSLVINTGNDFGGIVLGMLDPYGFFYEDTLNSNMNCGISYKGVLDV